MKLESKGRKAQEAHFKSLLQRMPSKAQKKVLQGLKSIQNDPKICDGCWAEPCICHPFPCECGGSIEVSKEDLVHSKPSCPAFDLAPDATAERAVQRRT